MNVVLTIRMSSFQSNDQRALCNCFVFIHSSSTPNIESSVNEHYLSVLEQNGTPVFIKPCIVMVCLNMAADVEERFRKAVLDVSEKSADMIVYGIVRQQLEVSRVRQKKLECHVFFIKLTMSLFSLHIIEDNFSVEINKYCLKIVSNGMQ